MEIRKLILFTLTFIFFGCSNIKNIYKEITNHNPIKNNPFLDNSRKEILKCYSIVNGNLENGEYLFIENSSIVQVSGLFSNLTCIVNLTDGEKKYFSVLNQYDNVKELNESDISDNKILFNIIKNEFIKGNYKKLIDFHNQKDRVDNHSSNIFIINFIIENNKVKVKNSLLIESFGLLKQEINTIK